MPAQPKPPSDAEFLASLVTGKADLGYAGASVQRSHRFHAIQFWQIENMARMGGVPVSVIINELIAAGLEAVKKKLPADVVEEISRISDEQSARPLVTDKFEGRGRKPARKAKA